MEILMKKSVAKSVQQNLCCAICLRTTRRHWRTTGATKDMKNPRMYADLGDCLHFDGLRWKSYWLGIRIRGAHPCALPLRGQLRRYAAPLFTFGFPE